jgi:hypothetical protein
MEENLPAAPAEHGLTLDMEHDLHADHADPQRQVVRQNLRVGLLPLALIAFMLIAFIAAAWTFLAALPAT